MLNTHDALTRKENRMHLKAAKNSLVHVMRNTTDDYDRVKLLVEKIDLLLEYGLEVGRMD